MAREDIEVDSWREALAKIPKGQPFVVKQRTNGRAKPIAPPDGEAWTHDAFTEAIESGSLPNASYILQQQVSGKASSRKVSFSMDLDEASSSIAVGQPGEDQAVLGSAYVQADLVDLLRLRLARQDSEVDRLHAKLRKRDKRIAALHLEIQALKAAMEHKEATTGLEAAAEKLLMAHGQGPLGTALLSRMLGLAPQQVASVVAETAAKVAT